MKKEKNKTIAILLAIFIGSFGIHQFYLGNVLSGVLYLLFFWTGVPCILSIVNIIQYLCTPNIKWDIMYNK